MSGKGNRRERTRAPAGRPSKQRGLPRAWVVAGILTFAAVGLIAATRGCRTPDRSLWAPVQRIRVVERFPHDPDAFTQGLAFHDGRLFEGTGQEGKSSLREVELETGEILRIHRLDDDLFGEGIAVVGDRIVQLTWRDGIGFVYDLETFELRDEFRYRSEGWGIAYDGERLVTSDGTATLRFLDPATFEETGRLVVRDGGFPVQRLNELEWIDGEIWANVWKSDEIVRIDPESGRVLARVDLTGLLSPSERPYSTGSVLNGIAYEPRTRRIFVTGKNWPYLFQIEIR